jgi:hypothetical protein
MRAGLCASAQRCIARPALREAKSLAEGDLLDATVRAPAIK